MHMFMCWSPVIQLSLPLDRTSSNQYRARLPLLAGSGALSTDALSISFQSTDATTCIEVVHWYGGSTEDDVDTSGAKGSSCDLKKDSGSSESAPDINGLRRWAAEHELIICGHQ